VLRQRTAGGEREAATIDAEASISAKEIGERKTDCRFSASRGRRRRVRSPTFLAVRNSASSALDAARTGVIGVAQRCASSGWGEVGSQALLRPAGEIVEADAAPTTEGFGLVEVAASAGR